MNNVETRERKVPKLVVFDAPYGTRMFILVSACVRHLIWKSSLALNPAALQIPFLDIKKIELNCFVLLKFITYNKLIK